MIGGARRSPRYESEVCQDDPRNVGNERCAETEIFHPPNPAPVAADMRAGLLKDPGFGRVFTDHMVTIRWTKDGGWQDAQLRARAPISLDPAAAVLHYGQEIFEGLKAYRRDRRRRRAVPPGAERAPLQARPRAWRMPELPEALFLGSIDALVKADVAWVPGERRQPLPAAVHVRDRGLPRRASGARNACSC